MEFIYGSHIIDQFDVHVDGNHRWDTDRMLEVDVYPVSLTNEGLYETDTNQTLASVKVPGQGYSDDTWIDYGHGNEGIPDLPKHIREAFDNAVALAKEAQNKAFTEWPGEYDEPSYFSGDTVFITEHRFPGQVEAHTANGGYIVHMADSGELAEFAESELEEYKQWLWEGITEEEWREEQKAPSRIQEEHEYRFGSDRI